MTNDDRIGNIKAFLERNFPGRTIGVDDDIFAGGFANSLFAMQLVAFVENRFGIEIDSGDLDVANFASVARIAALVERKRAYGAAPT